MIIAGNNRKQQTYKKISPSVYEFIFENHLDWPCTTCQWSSVVSQNEDVVRQKILFASKTDGSYNDQDNVWQNLPSTLIVASIDIPKQNKIFNQSLRDVFLQEKLKKHNNLKVLQILVHPGDANVMKKCPLNQKIIATKNDSNLVYLWDLDKHKGINNFKENGFPNQPDITLIGHNSQEPSFALDWSKTSFRIASGGKDLKILIWDLDDYQSKMQSSYMYQSKRELNSIGSNENLRIAYTHELKGHTKMIEDISFHPKNKDVLVSVSDDRRILFWDIRVSTDYTGEINGLHTDDINCVDWSLLNENYIATGSSDGTANIIDIRKNDSIIQLNPPKNYSQQQDKNINEQQEQQADDSSILSIQFSPFNQNYVAVGGSELFIYDLKLNEYEQQNYPNVDTMQSEEKEDNDKNNSSKSKQQQQVQSQIDFKIPQNDFKPIFTHIGCPGIVNNFEWNSEVDWTILTTCQELSEELNSTGGGHLQTFRPLDLTYLDKETALQKMKDSFQKI